MKSNVQELIAPLWNSVYLFAAFAVLCMIFGIITRSAWFKGLLGEFAVNVMAKLLLNKRKYHLIKNVTLPTEDGSTQIDHIIVSRYGVFVVETKNMKGWIFGSPSQKTWTQKIYRHSSKFQNPLHQNYKHVKTLESLLGLNGQQLHSVVVFVGDNKLKTEMPDNVRRGIGYIRYVKSKKEVLLSEGEVHGIIEKIEGGRLAPSYKTNREHVKHVKSITAAKEAPATPSCPKCGSGMALKKAKKGQNAGNSFWGCSKFPACRAIVSIS